MWSVWASPRCRSVRREHEGASGPRHPVPSELEYRPSLKNHVQLLSRVRLGFVVLVDDSVARVTGRPGCDTEGRDAEVVPDRSKWLAPVVYLVDLVQSRDCVVPHRSPLTSDVLASISAPMARACAR